MTTGRDASELLEEFKKMLEEEECIVKHDDLCHLRLVFPKSNRVVKSSLFNYDHDDYRITLYERKIVRFLLFWKMEILVELLTMDRKYAPELFLEMEEMFLRRI